MLIFDNRFLISIIRRPLFSILDYMTWFSLEVGEKVKFSSLNARFIEVPGAIPDRRDNPSRMFTILEVQMNLLLLGVFGETLKGALFQVLPRLAISCLIMN
jgi:hypothetical protein